MDIMSNSKSMEIQEVKLDLFEDDDEFELFPVNEFEGIENKWKKPIKWADDCEDEDTEAEWKKPMLWADGWEDEDINDDFSLHIRRDLEEITQDDITKGVKSIEPQNPNSFSISSGESKAANKRMKLDIDLNKFPEDVDKFNENLEKQQTVLPMLKIYLPNYF